MSVHLVGLPLIGMPQGAEWLVILAIVVLVFGAAKLPELARGAGQALRIFKSETKEIRDDDKSGDASDTGGSGTARREIEGGSPAAGSDPVSRERRDDTTA